MDILFDHEDQVELLGFTPEVIQRYSHDMHKIRKAIAEFKKSKKAFNHFL
jgi:hypothetical protein